MSVGGVSGKGGAGKPDAKAGAKKGAFPPVDAQKGAPGTAGKAPAPEPTGVSGGFRVAKQEPIKTVEKPVLPPVDRHVIDFTQGMVHAADAACLPGPTSDSDLLPRESVSGLFIRDFALQGAVALGRPPLGEDEAARIVIEKHIAGQPGLYYDANVQPAGEDHFLVRLHRLSPNPPFLPDPKAEASYRINRRTWQIDEG